MPDMHGFGDVGAGVVDDDGLVFSNVWQSEFVVGDHVGELRGDPLVFERDVDEAGPSDFNFLNEVGQNGGIDELLTDGTWIGFERFGELHGGVALVVAKLFVATGVDAEVDAGKVGVGEAGCEGFGAPG